MWANCCMVTLNCHCVCNMTNSHLWKNKNFLTNWKFVFLWIYFFFCCLESFWTGKSQFWAGALVKSWNVVNLHFLRNIFNTTKLDVMEKKNLACTSQLWLETNALTKCPIRKLWIFHACIFTIPSYLNEFYC